MPLIHEYRRDLRIKADNPDKMDAFLREISEACEECGVTCELLSTGGQ